MRPLWALGAPAPDNFRSHVDHWPTREQSPAAPPHRARARNHDPLSARQGAHAARPTKWTLTVHGTRQCSEKSHARSVVPVLSWAHRASAPGVAPSMRDPKPAFGAPHPIRCPPTAGVAHVNAETAQKYPPAYLASLKRAGDKDEILPAISFLQRSCWHRAPGSRAPSTAPAPPLALPTNR